MLMSGNLSSASTTLIVPGVGVSTYKSIGFLINSDMADCFHISKSDSCSSGNIDDGDFHAGEKDFETIAELANYVKANDATTMNEVNIKTSIDSVVGLFINECQNKDKLLAMIYMVKKCLAKITAIDYPIYLYNSRTGSLSEIELTYELEQEIIHNLKTTQLFYWPDNYDNPVVSDIKDEYINRLD